MFMGQLSGLLSLLLTVAVIPAGLGGEVAKRRFTVADDIALTHFGDPYTGQAEAVTFSPDGRYFVVDSERGVLEKNRPESTLRIYRTAEIQEFLDHTDPAGEPRPVWILTKSTSSNGPIISHIRWLADSSGIAFLEKTASGSARLVLADLKSKTEFPLTPESEHVKGFDVRDHRHYVYSAQSPTVRERFERESHSASIVATGRNLWELLFPADLYPEQALGYDRADLWCVIDGSKFQIKDSAGQPVILHYHGENTLALSPDYRSVVVALGVPAVPREWESLYLPPWSGSPYKLRAGPQDLSTIVGYELVSEYVRIDLEGGRVVPLTGAPLGETAGWWAMPGAEWSADGEAVLVTNTFVPSSKPGNRPCVAVYEWKTERATCVERLAGRTEDGGHEAGWRTIRVAHFAGGTRRRVVIDYYPSDDATPGRSYTQNADGSWTAESNEQAATDLSRPIRISVKQDLNLPPVLVGTDLRTHASRILWDPNPQLKEVELGQVTVFRWKDGTGREWMGGLFKPQRAKSGERFPLVIQTHGFEEHIFDASGAFPTAFAAQELAAAGIAVLQVRDCSIRTTPEEAPCQIAGYEAAIHELASEGLVDPARVGIIGFSRTCYYVMEAVTNSRLDLRAASITDGINLGYFEYLSVIDGNNSWLHEADAMVGAKPVGAGLEEWLKHSPEFNLDKVATPLLVVARGRGSLPEMWEPFAMLRYLNKPTDLVLLPQEGTHVLTNPGQRLASQGGTVDWFRFWLKGEEDSDIAKAEQYKRWRELRKMQERNEKNAGEEKRNGAPQKN